MRLDKSHFIFPLIFLFAFVGLLPPRNISAADTPQLYFKTTAESFAPGSEFTVGVFIGSEKPINALHIEIGYSSQTLEFLNFNTNFSVIEFWRKEPEILSDGIIKIDGGAAKAFSGRAGEIIKLNFRAKQEGLAQWSFRKAQIYYADGLGTLAQSKTSPMSLSISAAALGHATLAKDERTPILLDVQIAKDPTDDSRLAIFQAIDKESGLKGVYLRFRKWLLWEDWQRATNPVRLAAGVWTLQIKAVDNQDNVSVETLYVGEEIFLKLLYIALFFGAAFMARYHIKLRRRKKLL